MPVVNAEKWDSYVSKNNDPYGKCCVDVARQVMKVLDENDDFDTNEIICKADDEVGGGGITGFMAGAVATMVGQCHSRGEEFRKKWNKSYGVKDTAKGTVNPAIITIKKK